MTGVVTNNEAGLILPKRFSEVQNRDIETVDVDDTTGEVRLRAVPYGVETQLAHDLWEMFEPASLARAANAPSRVKMHLQHGGALVGAGKEIEDRADGLYVTMRFASTLAGQEARTLAVEGFLDQCSISFRPMSQFMKVNRSADGLHVRHSRAHLLSVDLVDHGAYAEGSAVLSARDENADRAREEVIARLRSLNH